MEEIRYETLSSDGIHQLKGIVYLPTVEPKGYFHVVHGMKEYIGRYRDFMLTMAQEGYICFGYDHLGHGETAAAVSMEDCGFIASESGWNYLCKDVARFGEEIRRAYPLPGKPYILLGHSMGSFIVRIAAKDYIRPDKLIVMGTGGPNPAVGAGIALCRLIAAVCGERHVSKCVDHLAFGSYNTRFADESCEVSWLTKDARVREAYLKDPFSNYGFTVRGMQDLLSLSRASNTKKWFSAFPTDLPTLFVSGESDPVGDYGKGVRCVIEKLQAKNADVHARFYPNCRHEILNDSCREDVIRDILAFTSNS